MSSVGKLVVAMVLLVGGIGWVLWTGVSRTRVHYRTVESLRQGPARERVRVAGRVERGSVVREGAERDLLFRVADASGAIPVRFRGPVPDMFQEDREVIVEGWIGAGGTFEAENLLTKCPSKYEGLPAAGHPDGVPAGAAPTSAGPPGS